MSDPRETLNRIRAQADAATEGPWAPWRDQDGAPHMNGLLMVGNAAAVIPEGESWVEGVDVNPIAHTYTPEDREFIAAARTDVPDMAAALRAVLELHKREESPSGDYCDECFPNEWHWPCSTVATIRQRIGDDL